MCRRLRAESYYEYIEAEELKKRASDIGLNIKLERRQIGDNQKGSLVES